MGNETVGHSQQDTDCTFNTPLYDHMGWVLDYQIPLLMKKVQIEIWLHKLKYAEKIFR